MAGKEQQWLLTHDSHKLKKGEVYKGETLPLWLAGKAIPVSDQVLEVATPGELGKLQADLEEANGKVASLTEANTKLQADLEEANGKVASLTEANTKLQADLEEAQKQLAELQKKAK